MAADPFVMETCVQQVVNCSQSVQREAIPSFLGKEKKMTLVSRMSRVFLPTGIRLSISQAETTAHWQIDNVFWQTSRLIHQTTKACEHFLYGSWRSSHLLQPWVVLLLLYGCSLPPQLHSWRVHLMSSCMAMLPTMLWEDHVGWPSPSQVLPLGFPWVMSEQRGEYRSGGEAMQKKYCIPWVKFGNPTRWAQQSGLDAWVPWGLKKSSF